jgi:hypothetical protein
MDYSKLPNPYDFANPVNDPKLFAGRHIELEEINYYLDHAKNASRAINLAIIGERASGKTSLLNMVQIGAEQRGFCVVRIELDESDADNQLPFFYKIFDSILTTVCKQNAFGGITGQTYQTYRNMVDAYEIPKEKEFCSFIFPMQYANAMNKGNVGASLSDSGFKTDLNLIHTELKKSIAILIDECDILTKSRVHLEKIRNIFMNISGYMLVFTGTESFFPLINDVFSPIIRQFKKINVVPFDNEKDTEECIKKPLKNIGIARPYEIFDFETYQDVSAIHDLSGGRPYEIQLICHLLFRRVQQKRSEQMELTLDVLDDVLRELRSSQDMSIRPIVNKIRSLDKDQLSTLSTLCSCNPLSSFDQIWFYEYLRNGKEKYSRDYLLDQLNLFIKMGLIKIDNEIINFAGDDFDRIYFKYYSRKNEVYGSLNGAPFEIRLIFTIDSLLIKKLHCLDPLQIDLGNNYSPSDFQNVFTGFQKDHLRDNPFDAFPDIAFEIYKWSLENQGCQNVKVATINLSTPWNKMTRSYLIEANNCLMDRCEIDFKDMLSEARERALSLNGNIEHKIYDCPILPKEILDLKIEESKNLKIKNDIYHYHIEKMYELYTQEQNIQESLFHGKRAFQYMQRPEPMEANNLGYLFMIFNETEIASQLFNLAIKSEENEIPILALASYNSGINLAKENKLDLAIKNIQSSIEYAKKIEETDLICACLIIPKSIEEKIEFEEVRSPNLLETAQTALDVLNIFVSKIS